MLSKSVQKDGRARRKRRIRKNISGTSARPRLSVFRSNRHIYVQIIDDVVGGTLVSASTQDAEVRAAIEGLDKSEAAKKVGATAAERAIKKGITQVVFDRNGYLYHGRVAAVAEGAREGGLDF